MSVSGTSPVVSLGRRGLALAAQPSLLLGPVQVCLFVRCQHLALLLPAQQLSRLLPVDRLVGEGHRDRHQCQESQRDSHARAEMSRSHRRPLESVVLKIPNSFRHETIVPIISTTPRTVNGVAESFDHFAICFFCAFLDYKGGRKA